MWEVRQYVGGVSVCCRCIGMLQAYRYVDTSDIGGVSVCG